MPMIVCSMPECQTTLGCVCSNRWQKTTSAGFRTGLDAYSDDEIETEYHRRGLGKNAHKHRYGASIFGS